MQKTRKNRLIMGAIVLAGTLLLTGCDAENNGELMVDAKTTVTTSLQDAHTEHSGKLKFKLTEDGAAYWVIGSASSSLTEIDIPAYYNGKPVTGIGENAFYNHYDLKSVILPDTVTTIQAHAFDGCMRLEKIKLSNNLINIGDIAFAGCALKSIDLPDCLKTIGEWAFSSCDFKSVVIPAEIKTLEHGVFNGCSSLESIELPDGLTKIGNSAFDRCFKLSNITIPGNVVEIGERAFNECNISSIHIPQSVTRVGVDAFDMNLKWIEYAGTIEQWDAIIWDGHRFDGVVDCTDGSIYPEY